MSTALNVVGFFFGNLILPRDDGSNESYGSREGIVSILLPMQGHGLTYLVELHRV
jgi:hypothetical protein